MDGVLKLSAPNYHLDAEIGETEGEIAEATAVLKVALDAEWAEVKGRVRSSGLHPKVPGVIDMGIMAPGAAGPTQYPYIADATHLQ